MVSEHWESMVAEEGIARKKLPAAGREGWVLASTRPICLVVKHPPPLAPEARGARKSGREVCVAK